MQDENVTQDFEDVIRKSPRLFDEILRQLLAEHDLLKTEELKKDTLFILLILIMMENGFQEKVNDTDVLEGTISIDEERLSKWKLSGLYETAMVMLGFHEMSAKLIMIPLGSNVLVNVIINEMGSETYSVCLPVHHYVEFSRHEPTSVKCLRNIKQLLDTFKNKVLCPVKSKLLSLCGYPGASLVGLPEDVFLKIMFYLPVSDVISVCKTCKIFNKVLSNDNFWHKLFIRDYRLTNVNVERSWKVLYQDYYIKHRDKKQMQYYPRSMMSSFFDWIF